MGYGVRYSCALVKVLLSIIHLLIGHVNSEDWNDCDLYKGSWVYDDESYPLYTSTECPFIEMPFDCVKNGRPDEGYLKYRWKPSSCKLPRFDGQDFLRRLRGKKIMFVGDSISLNQWQSLTCMLHIAVPQANYTLRRKDTISRFTFPEYNVSLIMNRNPFLVDMLPKKIGQVLKLDSVKRSSKSWKGIDMLIFNTLHWWLHGGRKQKWNFIEEGNKRYKDMDRLLALKKGLTTWGKWIDSKIDPSKTKVFYQGASPYHYNGSDWNEPTANCSMQTEPLNGSTYPAGQFRAEIIVKRVLKKLSKPVYLLDVTALSQPRKDGHPSVYGNLRHLGMDCGHWCLPGVPDTWNQLFYDAFLKRSKL